MNEYQASLMIRILEQLTKEVRELKQVIKEERLASEKNEPSKKNN